MHAFFVKFIRLFRFLLRRLREPRGIFRLYREIVLLVRKNGPWKLFLEIAAISNEEQRPLGLDAAYREWIAKYDYNSGRDRRELERGLEAFHEKIKISIVLSDFCPEEKVLRDIVRCLNGQVYPCWELCVPYIPGQDFDVLRALEELAMRDRRFRPVNVGAKTDGEEALSIGETAAHATGDFLLFLSPHDRIPENALYEIASGFFENRRADIIYADEDWMDREGRRSGPIFKPDWNETLLLSQDYIKNAVAIRRTLFETLGGFRAQYADCLLYDLLLRASGRSCGDKIVHRSRILYHRAGNDKDSLSGLESAKAHESRIKAVQCHLDSKGIDAAVEPGAFGTNRVRYALPDSPPMVSVIIPTRDRVDLLRQSVDAVLNRTGYKPLEIVIVDNDSKEEATLDYFKQIAKDGAVRILPYPGAFNYSAMINRAADYAKGEYLCLFNNDIDAIHADWLSEMVARAMQRNTGAVGAKLLYADERIQHAGVFLGMKGVAEHAYKFMKRDEAGYQARLQSAQQLLAVTAACLVVEKSKFIKVGGFDAENLKVAFNDVDFCLKLHVAGYQNIYTPHAELFHLESASRGLDMTSEQQARFASERDYLHDKWRRFVESDPFHSPNLSKRSDDFSLRE